MRLLDTERLELREFSGESIPPYAILSHTWIDGEEISLNDMQFLNKCNKRGFETKIRVDPAVIDQDDVERYFGLSDKAGYDKIKRCCQIAASDGFEYIWADTCCIDKTSSAELSEAINSMYRWYKEAEVCYAYLSDVAEEESLSDPAFMEAGFSASVFCASRWFTRGWTLQELIAPSSVIFFNANWKEIGTKSSLKETIHHVTGIQIETLSGDNRQYVSVAQKMSWASKRKTTRVEDLAYCLMGLFAVNMPMLYGEGDQAFIRLQEEIIRNTDDHSILAWRAPAFWTNEGGVLADTPAAFEHSGKIVTCKRYNPILIGLTSRGVHLTVPSKYWAGSSYKGPGLAVLNCEELGNPGRLVAIFLKNNSGARYARHRRQELTSVEKPDTKFRGPHNDVYIWQRKARKDMSSYPYSIEMVGLEENGVFLQHIFPRSWKCWDGDCNIVEFRTDSNLLGALQFVCHDGMKFAVVLKTNGKFLSAIAPICTPATSNLLAEIFGSDMARPPETVDSRFDEKCYSDRAICDGGGRFRICVSINRKRLSDITRLLVEISCVKAPESLQRDESKESTLLH